MAMDEKGLGHRLQVARQAAGLTQQTLCQKANLSYSTLAKIERGAIRSPSIFTIQSIASALKVSLDELIGQPSLLSHKQRQHSKNGVGFVYFDINGCLVRFYHRAFVKLAEDSGQLADTIETAFWHYNDQICRGEMSMEEFNASIAKRLNIPSLDWQKYYFEAIEPMPEMHALLRWVSDLYGVGLLTNVMPGFVEVMRQRNLIPDIAYDAIIDSSVVHAIKPEAKIYDIATQRADCPPSELLLIDDSRANLMGAEKSGWNVLWFDDYRPDESAARIRAVLEPLGSSLEQVTPVAEAPLASPSVAEQTAGVPA